MSATWQVPRVTLSLLGAIVNYLLTHWTEQSSWACCNLAFRCLCVCDWSFYKTGQGAEETIFALRMKTWLCNSACGTVRANTSSSLSPPCSVCLWSPYQMYPIGCRQEKLSNLTTVSSPCTSQTSRMASKTESHGEVGQVSVCAFQKVSSWLKAYNTLILVDADASLSLLVF